jgi:DNA-binding protein H-NS
MKPHDLKSMSVDELLSLHEFVSGALARKIPAEKARLDQRLRGLGLGAVSHNVKKMSHARRSYPQVFPKYRNPAEPSETWAGRGKKPRWLTAQLKSGKQIDDFRIERPRKRLLSSSHRMRVLFLRSIRGDRASSACLTCSRSRSNSTNRATRFNLSSMTAAAPC